MSSPKNYAIGGSKDTSPKNTPMVPGFKEAMPVVYGDTPSFLGVPVVRPSNGVIEKGLDVIFAGVPWEGTVTWGSFSGCELATRTIRHASARYGGYLPEYDVDLFDHLSVADAGDVPVDPNDPLQTMKNVRRMAADIYLSGAIPVMVGGDHSFSPEVVSALAEHRKGSIGIIHFDAHMDNVKIYGEDYYPRCGPLHRIAVQDAVNPERIVHVAIRGPRNSPSQVAYARELGSTIFTSRDIHGKGIEAVIKDAIRIAAEDTDRLYVTICSDCIDAGFNPGGPVDFGGMTPYELFTALYRIGQHGFDGIDFVEIYPNQDPNSTSSHLAAWAIIYALAGLAQGRSVKG